MPTELIRVRQDFDLESELVYSGDGENAFPLVYHITGTSSSPAAYNALLGGDDYDFLGVAGLFDGCALRTIGMRKVGPTHYVATCHYTQVKAREPENERLAVGSIRISWSTKGGKFLQTHAKTTVSYAPPGKVAPDFQGAINVTDDGVEGIEVTIPALAFTITKHQPGERLTEQYLNRVASLTGGYNDAKFLGFPAGTLKFEGTDGNISYELPSPNQVGGDGEPIPPPDREVSYDFLYSPNLTNLTIGEIEGINKKGHQHLWVLWQQMVDETAKWKVRRPKAVYVQDVGIGPVSFKSLNCLADPT
jgi:hypothetical protein